MVAMSFPLSTALVEDLRRRIVEGELVPGQKLPSENELVAERGVSRTVVREALSRLQAEGLVQTRRGSGSFVLTPPTGPDGGASVPGAAPPATLRDRLDLLDYRVAIESEAAALAAARRTEEQAAVLVHAERAFAAAPPSPAEALRLDFAFHRSVVEAAGSPLLLQAVDALGPAMIAMPRRRLESGDATARQDTVAAEHAAVAAAILTADVPGAAAAMRTHLRSSARRLREEAESTGRG